MPGGDDRLAPKRDLAPPPAPVTDPDAPRKPDDEASSIAWPLGHPSAVGTGEVPKEPEPGAGDKTAPKESTGAESAKPEK